MIEDTLRKHIGRSKESLNAIAKATSIDYGTLYRFVHEKRNIQVHIVQKLCSYFGLELKYTDSRIVAAVRRVAQSLVARSRKDFKHRNGRINEDALHQFLISQERLPAFGADENEREVAGYYDTLAADHKARLLRDALAGLAAGNAFNQMSVKCISEIDRDLQEFKNAYQQLEDDEKDLLERWVSKAEELQREEYKLQRSHCFIIKVSVGHSYCDENGEEVDGNRVTLTPILMRKAINAWKGGKEFAPKNIFDLFT